jgi:hypothetical protein
MLPHPSPSTATGKAGGSRMLQIYDVDITSFSLKK